MNYLKIWRKSSKYQNKSCIKNINKKVSSLMTIDKDTNKTTTTHICDYNNTTEISFYYIF